MLSVDGTLVTVDVGFFSDFHGQLANGATGLMCAVDTMRAANPDTVILSNGDSIGGSAFESAVLGDDPTLEFLNDWLKIDASVLGNHEFDKGFEDVATRVTVDTDFPWLSANLSGSNSGYNADDVTDDYFLYTAQEGTENEVTIAFIGTTTPETPTLVSASGVAGLTFGNIYESTNAVAATLTDQADVIIAMTHYGSAALTAGGFSDDIDAVFTGHTHRHYVGTTTTAGGTEIPVIEPSDYGSGLGHIEVTIDSATGDVTLGAASVIDTSECAAVSDGFSTWLAGILAASETAGAQAIGSITDDLLRGTKGGNRGTESTIGNFLGNVALWQANLTQTADIGVINPGGIRADFLYGEDGTVTYADAFEVQPFGNTVGVVDLTGAQFVALLEQQWQEEGASRPMLRLGLSDNVSYEYDPAAPRGEHIIQVYIDGAPIDLTATYTVASNNFLLEGSDGFSVFTEGTNHVDTGMIDVDGLIAYFEANSPVSPDYTQYSIGITDVAGNLNDTTVSAGDSFEFLLSSLLFTNDEPVATEVTVLLEGREMGTFEIDATVEESTDDTGKAHVKFTIPETLPQIEGARLDVSLVDGTGQQILSRSYLLESEYTELAFYNITDFHGRIVEAAADLQCLMTDNPNAAFTSSGDNIGATTFVSAVANDIPTIDVLNAMGLDVSSLGNHELDKGWDDFYAKDDLANWPHVAANLFHADSMEPVLDTHVVLEVNGYQVAFVGAVPLTLPDKISPDILEGMVVTDPAAAMNEVAAELANNDEIDFIVGLMHDDAATFGTQLVGFDLAFGGDSHFTYEGTTADGAPLLQAGQYGEHLAYVSFSVDAEGTIVATHTELISLDGYSSTCGETEVTQIVAEAVAEASILGAEPIAEITADINRGQNSDGAPGGNRGTESTLGNLIADAHLWAAQQYGTDVDFAFMNPGGLRADLTYAASGDEGDGVVTYEEAANVQPFGNTLMTVDLLGEDIIGILLEQWQYNDDGTPKSRPFLALGVSGLTYEYDPASETILAVYLADGSPLDPAATYTVVANSFLAAGGDGFASFLEGTNVRDTGMIDLTATVSYLEAQDGPISPDYTQRSIGITDLGDSDSITTGDVIKLHISSLSFTTNEPKPTELTVMFDGQVLGTFPVDNTITDNLNETGQATIEVTVPDLSGYAEGDEVSFVIGYEDAEGNFVEVLHWVYEMDGKGGTPGKPGTDPGKPGKPGKPLPPTGADVGSMPLLAGGFVLLGAAALWGAQRRQDVTL
ncbi:MAG TPA: hypothetical protein GX743_05725 [Actinomycetales bacterium]|nr:hypothetical protein [Actinomycetales bacterium]